MDRTQFQKLHILCQTLERAHVVECSQMRQRLGKGLAGHLRWLIGLIFLQKLCVTNLPPCLFDHTPPGVFDGQGSGHDFYGVSSLCPADIPACSHSSLQSESSRSVFMGLPRLPNLIRLQNDSIKTARLRMSMEGSPHTGTILPRRLTEPCCSVQTMWNPPSGFVSGMDGDRAGHFNCDYRQVRDSQPEATADFTP
jgi:hypothetical protein